MRDTRNRRARKLFNDVYPDRFWDLQAKPRRADGVDVGGQSATPQEREHFLLKANEELRREEAAGRSDT